jgi:hypothetical protein
MRGHTIHFDLKEEQGRIIDRTFYIYNQGEEVNSLALKNDRADALEDIRQKMSGIMNGKTMMVGFFLRGPVGAPASNPALEISSSTYVMHSAAILYRNVYADFDQEVEKLGHFYANIHSEGLNRPEDLPNARVYMDRSHRTTYSFNCTYAGNTLLMKKGNHRFSVDRSVYEKKGEQIAEHMFITGIEGPGGRITWMVGAAPSGCGKTTSAMAGDHFVGDDLAQLWIADDGTVRSINPECGIFGIVEDVNWEGDPYLMKCLRDPGTEVIWSNVLIDENGVPQWTGNKSPCRTPTRAAPCPTVLWKTIQLKMRPLRGSRPASLLTAAAIATPCRRSGFPRTPMRALLSAPALYRLPPPPKSGPPAFADSRGPMRPLPPDPWVNIWMRSLFSSTVIKLPTISDRFWRDSTTFYPMRPEGAVPKNYWVKKRTSRPGWPGWSDAPIRKWMPLKRPSVIYPGMKI